MVSLKFLFLFLFTFLYLCGSIAKTMIKNIILDFGKVLVDYDFKQFIDKIIPNESDRHKFSCLVLSPYWNNIFDKEDKPFGTYIQELKAQFPSFEPYIDAFDKRYQEIMTGEVPGMREVLTDLKQRGYKLYGLTNWCSKVYEVMNTYPIFKLLDGQVISCEEHIIKPDAAIYHRLLEKLNLKADECVFTDDREVNIIGATACGIKGIVFHNAEQFKQELNTLL